jgi:DNA polymerase III alpha subunit
VKERGESALRLFPRDAFLKPRGAIPVPPRYPPGRLLDLELETLGLTATAHPMELVRDGAAAAGAVPTKDLARHVGKRACVAGWVVTDRRVRTSGGRWMKFVMLEDLSGTVEAVFFPDAYRRAGAALARLGPLLVRGVVRRDHGALTFEAHDVEPLSPDEGTF